MPAFSQPMQPIVRMLARAGLFRAVCNAPKKTALAGGIALALAVAGGRAIVGWSPAPAPASALAAPVNAPALPDVQPQVSPAASAMQQWLRAPVAPLSRNVFTVRPEYFRFDAPGATQNAGDGGFWDEVGKSFKPQADEQSMRRQALDQIMQEAAGLKLESTIMGSAPQALVNGKLVREGDVVALFRVVKIEARGIIVEQKGIKLEILFKASAVQ